MNNLIQTIIEIEIKLAELLCKTSKQDFTTGYSYKKELQNLIDEWMEIVEGSL